MKIINSLGESEEFDPSKVLKKIKRRANGLKVDSDWVSQRVIASLGDGMTTHEVDVLSAQICESRGNHHPDYLRMAGNLLSERLQLNNPSFINTTVRLFKAGLLSQSYYEKVTEYNYELKGKLSDYIIPEKDFLFDYLGMMTLIGNNDKGRRLLSIDGKTVETPQFMFMRCAIWATPTLEKALEAYDQFASLRISLPSPILFNSGTTNSSVISCNLFDGLEDANGESDSLEGIHNTGYACSKISAMAAGIGKNYNRYRSKESSISTTGGKAAGLLRILKVDEQLALMYNQSGKRKGSWATYLEPWHRDFVDWVRAARPHTPDGSRAMDLFYGVWMCDLFMRKFDALSNGGTDDDWYLFCPNDLLKMGIDLNGVYGAEFEMLYQRAVDAGIGKKVSLKEIANEIAVSTIESGRPYMLFKDAVNRSNMQSHIGPIRSSNLCTEIIEYTDPQTIACCVLLSFNLPAFFKELFFDRKMFQESVRIGVEVLNYIIDINDYPVPQAKKGAVEQRALGLGVAGLADVYAMMDYPFESVEAKELNKDIFERLYYYSVSASNQMAKKLGMPKGMLWEGSHYSKGKMHPDFYMDDYSEPELKESIMKYGLYNTLFVAPMPTASSGSVLGVNECFEPGKFILYNREIEGSRYLLINRHTVKDFEDLGIWSLALSNQILMNDGILEGLDLLAHFKEEPTVYQINRISHIQKKYKSAYEKGMSKAIIDQAAIRLPYVDQSMSMNLFSRTNDANVLWSMLLYGWKQGLKTGLYYLKTKAFTKADVGLVMRDDSACGGGGCEV